ncbi:hypothetical protein D521_0437 [beta proteobacterium CB]|nr:hypothetical protein D521_0437 [beta proteobacterium CB]
MDTVFSGRSTISKLFCKVATDYHGKRAFYCCKGMQSLFNNLTLY